MTPKDKAKELVYEYLKAGYGVVQEFEPIPIPFAKQCALITADEIFKVINSLYWQEVKREIEKL